MSFTQSAENIRVDDGHILRASLRNSNGDLVDAELDLNQNIGNENGSFSWGGSGFCGSAQNISFSIEGNAQVPVLRAELRDCQGNPISRDLNLGERICNNNGRFEFN